MTMPSGDDPAYYQGGATGAVVGAGLAALAARTEANIRAQQQAGIENNNLLNQIGGMLFEGLRTGIAFPLAIVEALVQRLFGISLNFGSLEDALANVRKVPILGDLVEILTGIEDGDLNDLGSWFNNNIVGGIQDIISTIVGALTGLPSPGALLEDLAEGIGDLFNTANDAFAKATDALQDLGTLLFGIDLSQTPAQVWADVVDAFVSPLEKFVGLVGGFIDSLQIPVLDPTKILNLPGLFTDFGNTIEGFFQALTGQSGATSYVDPVEALSYLADQVSGTAQAVAQLQAANEGAENSGISGGDNFQTPSTGGPPPGWAASSQNGITSYVDTSTGKAQWHNSGNANPILTWRRTAAEDAKTLTEFQKVTATVATPIGGTNSSVRVYGRMSDDGQHYVVGYISNNTVYIAYTTTGVAGEVVLDSGPFPGGGNKLRNGDVISLECGTTEGQNEYDLKVNGGNAQSYTDTGNLITTSVNYVARGLAEPPKGWGVGWRPGLNLGSWYSPPTLTGCTISDNIPAEIKGHGFRVYRESSTAEELSVGEELSPYYDEIDYISPGSAWSAAGYVIPKSGMWSFSHRFIRTAGNWTYVNVGLSVNGVGRTVGGPNPDVNIAQDTMLMYCEKGDLVTLYISTKSGTVAMVGSSSGLDTYFSGALMSS